MNKQLIIYLRCPNLPNEISNYEEKLNVGEYDFEESYYTFEEQKCLQMVFETLHEILL